MSPAARWRRAAAVALAALVVACADSRTEEDARADDLWAQVQEAPELRLLRAFEDANRRAALRHANPHDAAGIGYRLRGLEALLLMAELTQDASETQRLAGEVADQVDELERGDLMRLYDEVRPGAAAELAALRERARKLVR